MISVHLQGKPFNITVIQVYAPTTNSKVAEVKWFYEDLQDLLELIPKKKRCPFHHRGLECKIRKSIRLYCKAKVIKRVQNEVLGCNLKNDRMISVRFQGKPFNITVIQVYAPTSNAEEAEQFYEDLQDLLELTPKKDVLFITGDWNAKVGSQETPGVTGKFGFGA